MGTFSNTFSINGSSNALWQPETITQKNRIEADGGTVIDLVYMNLVIKTLKSMGIYGNAMLLNKGDFGVRKDITGAVNKLYDISGNNNDAVQATGASQPIWSLVGGKGVITYDGVDDYLSSPDISEIHSATKLTAGSRIYMPSLILDNSIMVKWDYYTQGTFGLQTSSLSKDKIRLFIATTITDLGNTIIDSRDAVLTAGSLCSVSFVYNGTLSGNANRLKLNINGNAVPVVQTAGTVPSSLTAGSATVKSGKFGGVLDRFFKGQMNSSAIFNIALTQSQITQLYNLGL